MDLPNNVKAWFQKFKRKKIGVAMSGGLDSSIVAFLFNHFGANVKGYVMKTSNNINNSFTNLDNIKRLCNLLNIDFEIIDVVNLFEDKVINYFFSEYLKGKTPNPCVPCNIYLKFGYLRNVVLKDNEYFATGHYVIKKDCLYRPLDKTKDQSYVLSMIPKNLLEKVLFPLGYLKKSFVKKIALEYNLFFANKKESQDLCFLSGDRKEFFSKYITQNQGPILDVKGNFLGWHKGAHLYSIGQRKGLNINSKKRMYVKYIDISSNKIIVDTYEKLFSEYFVVDNVNWICKDLGECEVVVRNKMNPVKCNIYEKDKELIVRPIDDIWAVSPGQIAAFYKGDKVLGGGWIKRNIYKS